MLKSKFYRYMKELIEQGHVYIAQPPLYGIIKGVKVVKYCWTDEGWDYRRCRQSRGFGRHRFTIICAPRSGLSENT